MSEMKWRQRIRDRQKKQSTTSIPTKSAKLQSVTAKHDVKEDNIVEEKPSTQEYVASERDDVPEKPVQPSEDLSDVVPESKEEKKGGFDDVAFDVTETKTTMQPEDESVQDDDQDDVDDDLL